MKAQQVPAGEAVRKGTRRRGVRQDEPRTPRLFFSLLLADKCRYFFFFCLPASQYPDCSVKYIPGHNPDLVLRPTTGEMSRIDLTQYKSVDALHDLFATHGISRTPVERLLATEL